MFEVLILRRVLAELRTSFYVTFVIAVATALTVRMIFAVDTVMKTTVAVNRSRRIRIKVLIHVE
jgi:hypothetical protein